jgi:hypothetical protein
MRRLRYGTQIFQKVSILHPPSSSVLCPLFSVLSHPAAYLVPTEHLSKSIIWRFKREHPTFSEDFPIEREIPEEEV